MSMKTILALADGGGNDAPLKAAVALGRRLSAHVDVLHVRADPETMVPIVGEGMSGAMVEQVMESMARSVEARAARAREDFERVCLKSGLSVAWREAVGREPEILAAAGRLADVIVIGRPGEKDEAPLAASFDAALFDSGRPVLLVPPGAAGAIGTHVVLGWDGSAEAARAVSAALPLLAVAERVTVLTGGQADKEAPASALLAYLLRHGVRAHAETFAPGAHVGQALLAEAARRGADLVVMGAYGHSRLREMILGGTTREVLNRSTLPVLMAH
jgi:nucleotide-binding universal stress UspA family protein